MNKLIPNKNVSLVSMGFFLLFFGFTAAQHYLLPLFKLQGQENTAFISLLLIYFAFFGAGIFAPKIIPSLGLKASIVIGAFSYAFFALSVVLGMQFITLTASITVGVGAALLWVSGGQIIQNSSSEKELGYNLGFQYASFLFGSLLGTTFGGFFIEAFSLQKLYAWFTVAILCSIPFFLKIQFVESKIEKRTFKLSYIFDKKLVLLFPIIFAAYFLSAQTFTAINLLVLNLFGIKYVAIIAILLRISTIIGALVVGAITDKFKKESTLIILIFIGLAGTLVFIGSPNLTLIMTGTIFMGLFISAAYPVCLSLFKDKTSANEYAYALGAFHVYTTIAVLAAIFSARYLNPTMSFLPGIASLLISFGGVFFFSKLKTHKIN
ncbi:MAG: MFS transporter [Patescibacteria group bacterium]